MYTFRSKPHIRGHNASYPKASGRLGHLVQTAKAIDQCDVFVLLVSKVSLGSHQVTGELVHAHEAGKTKLPLLVDVTHSEMQRERPDWRQALGASISMPVPPDGVMALIPRILQALKDSGLLNRAVPEQVPEGT